MGYRPDAPKHPDLHRSVSLKHCRGRHGPLTERQTAGDSGSTMGWTGWVNWDGLVVAAVFVQYLVSCGPVYNYNVFFVYLQREFGTSAVATGERCPEFSGRFERFL